MNSKIDTYDRYARFPDYQSMINAGCEDVTTDIQKKNGTLAILTPMYRKQTLFGGGKYYIRYAVHITKDNLYQVRSYSPDYTGKLSPHKVGGIHRHQEDALHYLKNAIIRASARKDVDKGNIKVREL